MYQRTFKRWEVLLIDKTLSAIGHGVLCSKIMISRALRKKTYSKTPPSCTLCVEAGEEWLSASPLLGASPSGANEDCTERLLTALELTLDIQWRVLYAHIAPLEQLIEAQPTSSAPKTRFFAFISYQRPIFDRSFPIACGKRSQYGRRWMFDARYPTMFLVKLQGKQFVLLTA